jgi:hypothetical protein
MRLRLSERLDSSGRELQQALSAFGLREYSLANVIQALVAEANRVSRENPERASGYQVDLLRSVIALYIAEGQGKKRPDYPEQSPLQFPSQTGAIKAATTLYLGAGFGPRGEITQSLYGLWAPEKLLDATAINSLASEPAIVHEFLLWAGVAQWPRDLTSARPEGAYVEHTLRTIKFPASFEEKLVASRQDASYPSMVDVRSVDGLDEILANADQSAIAAWLANDDRAIGWSRLTHDHARLQAFPQGVTRPRRYAGAVPSYVRWRIETTQWLRSVDGYAIRPKDCVLGERAIEELFPRPALPTQEVLERFGTTAAEILEGWRHAGVLTSLAYLQRDEIYAKLLELPERSPDGKLARPLYQWLLDASDVALGGDGPNQTDFLTRGRMWGRHGKETAYFAISELHHADSEGLPDTLLNKLKIVDLRKRVGADKVDRLFGVKAVDRAGIQRRIVAKDLAPGSSDANSMFEEAKPYLHKLRLAETKQHAQLQALKELRLEVCSALRVAINFEQTSLNYDVPVWGWLIEDKVLYVRSDPARPMEFSESLLSNAICEALASVIFRIADGGDFARMLACRESDRLELLRRLRGDAAVEDIGVIKAEYSAFKPPGLGVATFPVPEPPRPVVPTPQPTPPGSPTLDIVQPIPPPTPPVGSLIIGEMEHVPEAGPSQRKLQVKTIASSGGGPSRPTQRVTDGDFCERKAMEFEEASHPSRWPLLVGQVMGVDGPGCDVLSFGTREERETFRVGLNRDLNSVLRFIEVKGRGSASATIELKGNELSAAERYGDRYFLYRLFEAEDGSFELSVLGNPLTHKEALRPAVHVGMEQASATQRFALVGGLSKQHEQS